MFGKMMNRYFYGKSGQGDYEPENLPRTRMQLFWEMLRIRFSGLVRLNLMYMVAWIPAMAVIARGLMAWYSGMAGLQAMQAEAGASAAALAQSYALWEAGVRALTMQTLLLLIPCIAVTGPFTAGLCYVTRNWARDEHAFVWSDFKDAVRENWKPALLTSAITGVVPLLLYVCAAFYGDMAAKNPLFLIPQALSVMVGAVWLLMLLYAYPQMVTYALSWRDTIKNSVLMAVGRFPLTVGFKALAALPTLIFAAVAFFTPYFQYALLAYGLYYGLIGFALSRFVGASYTNAAFDRLINTRIEGAQVNRGLYVEEEDEDGETNGEAPAASTQTAGERGQTRA